MVSIAEKQALRAQPVPPAQPADPAAPPADPRSHGERAGDGRRPARPHARRRLRRPRMRRLRPHPRPRAHRGRRLAAVPVHRPRPRRRPQPGLPALRAPDLAGRADPDRLAGLADQPVLGGDGRPRGRDHRGRGAAPRLPAFGRGGGRAGLRRRRHLLVPGGDRRGLHAAPRAGRRPCCVGARLARVRPPAPLLRRGGVARRRPRPSHHHRRLRAGDRGCWRSSSIGASRCACGRSPRRRRSGCSASPRICWCWSRSRDPQAYVESRATTLDGLAGVVLGGQFRDRLFTESWRAIAGQRMPALVARVFRPDLTIVGLVLAGLGALWLLRRRRAEAALLLTGAAIITGFVANYQVVDQPCSCCPSCCACGCAPASAWRRCSTGWRACCPHSARPRPAERLTGALALALPIWLAAQHGPRVDRSADRDDAPARRATDRGAARPRRHRQRRFHRRTDGAATSCAASTPEPAANRASRRATRRPSPRCVGTGTPSSPFPAPSIACASTASTSRPLRCRRRRHARPARRRAAARIDRRAGRSGGARARLRRHGRPRAAPSRHAGGVGGRVAAEHVASSPSWAVRRRSRRRRAGRGSRWRRARVDGSGAPRLRPRPVAATRRFAPAGATWSGRRTASPSPSGMPAGAFVRAFALIDADGYQVPLATTAFRPIPCSAKPTPARSPRASTST